MAITPQSNSTPFARIVTIVLCVIALNVSALPSDNLQSIIIDSATGVYDNKSGTTTYEGQVVMQRGSMKIMADKLVIYGRLKEATKIVATGTPARFQMTQKADASPVTAEANILEYQVENEMLMLKDNATLDQDGSNLSASQIEYDVKNALVKAGGKSTSGENDGRVRMVIPPKNLQSIDDKK